MNIFRVHFVAAQPCDGCFVVAVDFNAAAAFVKDSYPAATIKSMAQLNEPGMTLMIRYDDLLNQAHGFDVPSVPLSTVKSTLDEEINALRHRYEAETGQSPLIGGGHCSMEYADWMQSKLAMIPLNLLDAWARVYQNKKA